MREGRREGKTDAKQQFKSISISLRYYEAREEKSECCDFHNNLRSCDGVHQTNLKTSHPLPVAVSVSLLINT